MTHLPVAIHYTPELAARDDGQGFQAFVQHAMQAPLLSEAEEYQLAVRFQQHSDLEAAHKLVQAHLRLVLKIAREYLNYRMSLLDLVQEGSVGLMHAVKKFDPDRGSRLSTYAIWWIRAAIHEFILRSWRMVKIATTQLKRHLFFKLRQSKESLAPLNREEAEELAQKLGGDVHSILEMDGLMGGGDLSLNQPVLADSGEEMIDRIPDRRPNPEERLLQRQQKQMIASLVRRGMERLDPREQRILSERFLAEKTATLESLAQELSISRERVRQVEKRAMEKLRTFFQSLPEGKELFAAA